jgi:putative membrane protein
MKHPTTALLAAAITAALAAGPAWSQGGPASPTPASGTGSAGSPGTASDPGGRSGSGVKSGQLSTADRKFVTEAAEAGMAEVAAGRLAVQKAQDPMVKQFAQRMIDEHTAANGELMKLAGSRGVPLPSEPDRSRSKELDALQKRSGADFDRAYMNGQVADHQKAVTLFERKAKSGQDPELSQWAAKMLPTLREHLQMARSDAGDRAAGKSGAMGSSGGSAGNGSGTGATRASGGGSATGSSSGGMPGTTSPGTGTSRPGSGGQTGAGATTGVGGTAGSGSATK